MSEPHMQQPTPDDDQHAVLAAIESIIGDIADHEQRIGPRWRRIVRALHGLGLLDVVGRDWVRITPSGLAFAEITAADADRLARRLEDLEDGQRPTPSITSPPDHPRFEFPQPVLPPSSGISPHHLGEWR